MADGAGPAAEGTLPTPAAEGGQQPPGWFQQTRRRRKRDADGELRLDAARVLRVDAPEEVCSSGEVVTKYSGLAEHMGDPSRRSQLSALMSHMRTVFLDNGEEKEGSNMQRNIDQLAQVAELADGLRSRWPGQRGPATEARVDALYKRFVDLHRDPGGLEGGTEVLGDETALGALDEEEWHHRWLQHSEGPPPEVAASARAAPPTRGSRTPVSGETPPVVQQVEAVRRSSSTESLTLQQRMEAAGFSALAVHLGYVQQKAQRKFRSSPRDDRCASRRLLTDAQLLVPQTRRPPDPQPAPQRAGSPGRRRRETAQGQEELEGPAPETWFADWEERLWDEVRRVALAEADAVVCRAVIAQRMLREVHAPWHRMLRDLYTAKNQARSFRVRLTHAEVELKRLRSVEQQLEAAAQQPTAAPEPQRTPEEEEEHRRARLTLAQVDAERKKAAEAVQAAQAQLDAVERDLGRKYEEERKLRDKIAQLQETLRSEMRANASKAVRSTDAEVQVDWADFDTDAEEEEKPGQVYRRMRERQRQRWAATLALAACVSVAAMGTDCPCGRGFLMRMQDLGASHRLSKSPSASGALTRRASSRQPGGAKAKSPTHRQSSQRLSVDGDAELAPPLSINVASPTPRQEEPDSETPFISLLTPGSPEASQVSGGSIPAQAGGKRKGRKRAPSTLPPVSPEASPTRGRKSELTQVVEAHEAELGTLADALAASEKATAAATAALKEFTDRAANWVGKMARIITASVHARSSMSLSGLLAPLVAPGKMMKGGEELKNAILAYGAKMAGEGPSAALSAADSLMPRDPRAPSVAFRRSNCNLPGLPKGDLGEAADELRNELRKMVQGGGTSRRGEGATPTEGSITGRDYDSRGKSIASTAVDRRTTASSAPRHRHDTLASRHNTLASQPPRPPPHPQADHEPNRPPELMVEDSASSGRLPLLPKPPRGPRGAMSVAPEQQGGATDGRVVVLPPI